jgi:hypothetical protein
MFLPVLLIRDFGPASFFVFAVPNVLGAVLMGVLLSGPGASEQFVQRHRAACWWFSFVTLAFQAFFFAWMFRGCLPSSEKWVVAGLLPALLIRSHRHGWAALVGVGVFAASVGMAMWWKSAAPAAPPTPAPLLPTTDLAWLALVCVFGFGLCPYLDLTFHAARQRVAGAAGSVTFVVGFGVVFFSMILLTLAYAAPLLARSADAGLPVQPGLLAAPLLLHIGLQLTYTAMLHRDCLATARPRTGMGELSTTAAVICGVVPAVLAGRSSGLSIDPETIYRLFMAFYALVFPAYVWVCALRRSDAGPRGLWVYAAAVAVAAPMFWMASIERQTWWFGPGLLVVLLARFLVRPGSSPAARTAAVPPGPP